MHLKTKRRSLLKLNETIVENRKGSRGKTIRRQKKLIAANILHPWVEVA